MTILTHFICFHYFVMQMYSGNCISKWVERFGQIDCRCSGLGMNVNERLKLGMLQCRYQQ